MSSSSDNICGVTTMLVVVAPGATNAALVDACPYGQATTVKAQPGATGFSLIYLFGVGTGLTLAGSSLVAGYSNAWQMGMTETLTFDGATRFYLAATGATATFCLMRGLSTGSP